MRKYNKSCICCSTKYTFCTGCSEFDHLPRWHSIYCSDNCRKLFNAATDFLADDITKEQAKEQFNDCDLSYKDKLHHKIAEAINEVYTTENKSENLSSDAKDKAYLKKNKKNLNSDFK